MTGKPCKECRQPHLRPDGRPSCTSHSRGRLRPEIAGKPCGQIPMRGQKVCRVHGGASKQAKTAAEERIHREQQQALAVTLGAEPDTSKDPAEIITEQIAWRYTHVQWLRKRVQAVSPDALVWGMTKVKEGGDDRGITFEAKPNAWEAMYREWSRDLEKLCIEAIRVGVEQRRIELEERAADKLVDAIDGMLRDLGHDPNQPETAAVVERRLRAVGG